MDELEALLCDQTCFHFFTGVSTVEHKGSYESFDDGAGGFSKFKDLVFTSGVWDEYLGFTGSIGNVILKY